MLVISLQGASFVPKMMSWIWVKQSLKHNNCSSKAEWACEGHEVTEVYQKHVIGQIWQDIIPVCHGFSILLLFFPSDSLFVYTDMHLFWCSLISGLILTCVECDEISSGQLRRVASQTWHYECVFSDHLIRWSDFIHRFSRRKAVTYISCISLLLHLFSGRKCPANLMNLQALFRMF